MNSSSLIDKYLPKYTFSECHEIIVDNASIDRVYDIGRNIDLSKSWIIPLLLKLRGLPTHTLDAQGFISAMHFSNIEERPPTEILYGFMKTDKIMPVTSYQEFIDNAPEVTLKVVFSFQYTSLPTNQVSVYTETRVLCVGMRSRLSYSFYWYVIRLFSGLIRKEILKLIKQEAELEAGIDAIQDNRYPKQEMVAKLPVVLLIPLRLFFQVVGHLMPGLAASAFQNLLRNMPRKPLKEKEIDFLNSASPINFQCDDVDLVGYSFGEGPIVLMVHGLLGNSANYRAIIPILVEQGFRVIAFDSVNHGNSPDGIVFSNQSVKHMRQVIHGLGDIHAIISHSAGTYLVMVALLDLPPSQSVKKCVYMAAFPDARVTLLTFMDYFWAPKKIYPQLCRWFEEIGGIPFNEQSFVNCLPRHLTPDKPSRLFVHDKDDRQIPFFRTQEMLAGDAKAELYATQGLDHFKILKDTKTIYKIIDFLKQ